MKRWIALLLTVLLLLTMVGCTGGPVSTPSGESATIPSGSGTTSTESKTWAPDFTVYDADGKAHKLSDFRGKPVVLNFWASWCPPCKAEMPDFQKEFEAQGENVQFLMVNLTDGQQETISTAMAHITKEGYTFPVYFDTAYSAVIAYGIRSIPATYFIDAQGYLVAQATGAIDRETLQKGISMILR